MKLEVGGELLHYRLVEKIGEGGMGVVWKAVDTTLDREVAIKVLPEALAQDGERLARFEREAKLLASLSHPNIAVVYGLQEAGGLRFLAMELVPGEDLDEHLKRRPLSLEQTLRPMLQVAQALEAAHESGVVHRDLKPANIRLTADGKAKVLDFGLAKAFDPATPGQQADPALSPTLTSVGTVAGMILGTAAYMSPEQAAGQPTDKRCDIWSFGVVLYEMLAGERLFHGETVSHTLADVLRAEIDWDKLPATLPRSVRRLLERCLDRDPRRRLRDIGEARVALEDALAGTLEPAEEPTPAAPATPRRLPWLVAAAAGLIATLSLILHLLPEGRTPPAVGRFTIKTAVTSAVRQGDGRAVALSPDGRFIVTSGASGSDDVLHLRAIGDFESRTIEGATGALLPVFSPDGRWVAFATTGGISKVDLSGGPPRQVGSFSAFPTSATWSADDFIYYVAAGELWRVPSDGGEAQQLDVPGVESGHLRQVFALPAGRGLLVGTGEAARQPDKILALDPVSMKVEDLGLRGSDPRYLYSGHLIYAVSDRIFAVEFDAKELRVLGTPFPVLDRVMIETGIMQLDVAGNGTAVYIPYRPEETRDLILVDRRGGAQPIVSSPLPFADCNDVRLSPDGRRVAVTLGRGPVWVVDLDSETPTLLSENGFYPVWSPDGRSLIYGTTRHKSFDLYRRSIDLSRPEALLLDRDNNLRTADWAPDGTLIFREEIPGKGMDLRAWSDLDDEGSIAPLLEGPDDELAPTVSPDGRWMAYVSNQSGRDEIYVTSYPQPGARVQASIAGGTSPAWSPDGNELYYFQGQDFIAVEVETEPSFRVVGRETLFSGNYVQYRWQRQYDVHPDGEHFVMIKAPPSADLEVILNWFTELERQTARTD